MSASWPAADLPLHLRIVRDRAASTLERVLVDHPPSSQELRDFFFFFLPELCERLQAYRGERPLFESFGAEVAVREALERRVELDCGGFLVIDQTESMTTIDVNTGSFVGGADPVETVLQTNLEAATMVARQLRLRNLGGIIVIDFIDMSGREQRRQLESALRESLQRDPSPTTFSGMSDLGLAIVSRKLTGKNLLQTLGEECPRCLGRGAIKSARTICYDIAREVNRVARLGAHAVLNENAEAGLQRTRDLLERSLADGATIYGVNTGFGALSDTSIPADKLRQLQRNLLRSHAVGVGEPLAPGDVRALLALRALHREHGHLQEIIVQNFRAKPGTKMANAAEPDLDDQLWTIAVVGVPFTVKSAPYCVELPSARPTVSGFAPLVGVTVGNVTLPPA